MKEAISRLSMEKEDWISKRISIFCKAQEPAIIQANTLVLEVIHSIGAKAG